MEVEQNQSTTRWSQEKSQRISELENSKEYQDRLFLMKEQMKSNLHWRAVTILGIILAVLSFLLLRFRAVIIILPALVFYYLPQYNKRKALFGDNVRSNDEIYINDFLCPILKEVFPQAELTLTANYAMDALQVVSPRSTKFNLFNQLSFHDERNLTVEVTDFVGQLFSLKAPSPFPGHMRVVPTKKSFFFKREVKGAYPGPGKNEVQIETEDIQNNENYNIYCTDEFAARKFLKPKVLDWFDKQIAQNAMCVYLVEDRLYISLYTNRYIFPTPRKKQAVENLSLAAEYQKLCMEIDIIDELTNIFKGE